MTGTYRGGRRWRRAFTLVELLVASAVATIVTAGAMVLLIESAKENRRGFADATVEAAAAALQSKIIAYLRVMSATEGVIFATPATDGSGALLGYKGIIIARGPSPDFPREQITFDATSGKVVYSPNRNFTTNQVVLTQNSTNVAVRMVCFSPSLKADGTPDNSLVNVLIRMDDNGTSRRSASSNPANIWRTFSIRMRNT